MYALIRNATHNSLVYRMMLQPAKSASQGFPSSLYCRTNFLTLLFIQSGLHSVLQFIMLFHPHNPLMYSIILTLMRFKLVK